MNSVITKNIDIFWTTGWSKVHRFFKRCSSKFG